MNEEILSTLQQNQEKLDQLLDAQSAIPGGYLTLGGAAALAVATVVGVVITVLAAEKRQRTQLEHDRERQRRDEHRAKLEEALRLLVALKEWGDEVLLNTELTLAHVAAKSKDMVPRLDLQQNIVHEGENKYETVLAILEIYSAINDADVRLGKPFLDLKVASYKKLILGIRSDHATDRVEMTDKHETLITACNVLVNEVRENIRADYMP